MTQTAQLAVLEQIIVPLALVALLCKTENVYLTVTLVFLELYKTAVKLVQKIVKFVTVPKVVLHAQPKILLVRIFLCY